MPRVTAEGSACRLVSRTGVKKSVKKVLTIIAEIVNSGGTPTLAGICDHIHKQCTVRGAEAAILVQRVRSACQHAGKNGFLEADDKVFFLTDAGTKLLNSHQNATSSTVDLLLDKLLAEKVIALAIYYITYFKLLMQFM